MLRRGWLNDRPIDHGTYGTGRIGGAVRSRRVTRASKAAAQASANAKLSRSIQNQLRKIERATKAKVESVAAREAKIAQKIEQVQNRLTQVAASSAKSALSKTATPRRYVTTAAERKKSKRLVGDLKEIDRLTRIFQHRAELVADSNVPTETRIQLLNQMEQSLYDQESFLKRIQRLITPKVLLGFGLIALGAYGLYRVPNIGVAAEQLGKAAEPAGEAAKKTNESASLLANTVARQHRCLQLRPSSIWIRSLGPHRTSRHCRQRRLLRIPSVQRSPPLILTPLHWRDGITIDMSVTGVFGMLAVDLFRGRRVFGIARASGSGCGVVFGFGLLLLLEEVPFARYKVRRFDLFGFLVDILGFILSVGFRFGVIVSSIMLSGQV